MTNTTRLDEIIQRQRTGRSLDLLFAMFIAMLMVMTVAGLRRAAADSRHVPAITEAQAPAPACPTLDVC